MDHPKTPEERIKVLNKKYKENPGFFGGKDEYERDKKTHYSKWQLVLNSKSLVMDDVCYQRLIKHGGIS